MARCQTCSGQLCPWTGAAHTHVYLMHVRLGLQRLTRKMKEKATQYYLRGGRQGTGTVTASKHAQMLQRRRTKRVRGQQDGYGDDCGDAYTNFSM